MNKDHPKLVLLGNGFDLAHGLPTSYNQFMCHYLNNVIFESMDGSKRSYEDSLMTLRPRARMDYTEFKEASEAINFILKIMAQMKFQLIITSLKS